VSSPAARTARRVALAAFLLYAASGGGRIVGSDEVTMLELSRALLRGRVDVPVGATLQGRDGRAYTKNAAGQAILALPLVAVAEGLATATDLPPPRRTLLVRCVVSFFNAAVTAVLLGFFYYACRGFGVRATTALGGAILLGFTTPLWIYAKSFMAEPLQALGLLLALVGAARAGEGRWPWVAALGVLIAVSVKLSMLPFALIALAPLLAHGFDRTRPALGALAVALAGHAAYNLARFGTPLETGYGAQATPAAYTTPLLVGLYGLLLSPGKGVLWYAPALWVTPWAWKEVIGTTLDRPWHGGRIMVQVEPARRAALIALAMWIVALLLYGSFEHWAGDGSFGPRYLVPLLAPALIVVVLVLDGSSRERRRVARALGLLGLLVQLGGVGVYYGAQMREAGDYPYTRALSDPRFMSDSHFNPAYSPIAAHWKMLLRDLREHVTGRMPRIAGDGAIDPRLGVGAEDRDRLLHAIDLWWLYALYAGLPAAPVLAAALALIAAAVWAARLAWRSALSEMAAR